MSISRNCLICGKPGSPLGKSYKRAFLSRCDACRMVYSHIIPTNEELSAHYANYDRNIEVSKLTSDVYELWLRDWMSQGFQTHYDFGCGLGALVSFASSKGMQSVGSEIDASVVEKLRKNGIPAFETEFIRSNSDTYDVVTIIEVIEHARSKRGS